MIKLLKTLFAKSFCFVPIWILEIYRYFLWDINSHSTKRSFTSFVFRNITLRVLVNFFLFLKQNYLIANIYRFYHPLNYLFLNLPSRTCWVLMWISKQTQIILKYLNLNKSSSSCRYSFRVGYYFFLIYFVSPL